MLYVLPCNFIINQNKDLAIWPKNLFLPHKWCIARNKYIKNNDVYIFTKI